MNRCTAPPNQLKHMSPEHSTLLRTGKDDCSCFLVMFRPPEMGTEGEIEIDI